MSKRKKVAIIEPRGVTGNVFSDFMGLPLMGPIYLGSKLKEAGHDVVVLNENALGRPVSMRELDVDVCIISALTSTVERGYDILREYKALHPDGLALIGGVHATFESEEAALFADHVMTGEGEEVIVPAVEGEFSEKIVDGPRIKDLDTIPLPDFTVMKGYEKMPRVPLMTSRGCPFNCSFCSVTEMFGHRYRTNSVERVIEEFRRISRYTDKDIFIYDDNFTASPSRTRKILERKLQEGIKNEWTAQVRVDTAKHPELVELMAKSGCSRVYIGFESINNDSLDSLNKHQNIEDIRRAIEVFHKNQIAIHGMFILGVDEDPPETYKATVDFCIKHKMDSVQFLMLTPLPGTQFYKEVVNEGRLLHRRWQYYDLMHVVHRPKGRLVSDVQREMVQAFADFYSLKQAARNGILTLLEAREKFGDLRRKKQGTRVLGVQRTLVDLAAQKIIAEFKRANQGYMDYLEALDRKWLQEGGDAINGEKAALLAKAGAWDRLKH